MTTSTFNRLTPGATVALVGCRAEKESGRIVHVSGLWFLEEFLPMDRAAYIHEPGWLICRPPGYDHEHTVVVEPPPLFVRDEDLWAQVAPASYGRYLAHEREAEWHAGDDEETYGGYSRSSDS